jgi:hypothetical protein
VTINALQRRAQLVELRNIVTHLSATVDIERDEVNELRTAALGLEEENGRLREALACVPDNADDPLVLQLATEMQVAEELRAVVASLQRVDEERENAAAAKKPGQYYLGTYTTSLAPVIDDTPFAEYVKLRAVAGAATCEAKLVIGAESIVGADPSELRWHVKVVSLRGLPPGRITCRIRYTLDLDSAYEDTISSDSTGEKFINVTRRYYFPAATESTRAWCRSNDVIVIEVEAFL